MRHMRTRYCRARVLANSVYCEVIANKEHVHMNSTVWVTLNGFVRHLEETGQVKADWGSQRGPFISYIDREREAREHGLDARLKKFATPEEIEERRLREAASQVELAKERELQAEQILSKTICSNGEEQSKSVVEPVKVNVRVYRCILVTLPDDGLVV